MNTSAAEWIYRSGQGDLQEPWVFVADRSGTIVNRFDNVAGDAELRAAVGQVVA